MDIGRPELVSAALVLAFLGLFLIALAKRGRAARGLGAGAAVALDNGTLFSECLKLGGRPDRIVRQGETLIPEEWKSAKRVSDGHKLQTRRTHLRRRTGEERAVATGARVLQ